MQRKETGNPIEFADVSSVPTVGRIVGLDPGTKYVGVAVCDETQQVTRPLKTLTRTSWKKLLLDIKQIVSDFDAVAVVVGLPLGFEGGRIEMTYKAEMIAQKLALSLDIPVAVQDERVTTFDARKRLWNRGVKPEETKSQVDAEAAPLRLVGDPSGGEGSDHKAESHEQQHVGDAVARQAGDVRQPAARPQGLDRDEGA